MTETDESVQPAVKQSRIKANPLVKKAAGVVAAGLIAGIATQEVQPVSADTPTPSPTSTATSTITPDADATKIATLQTAIAEQQKKNERKTVIAALEQSATALAKPPTETPTNTLTPTSTAIPKSTGTPTPTSTPDSAATAEARATIADASARYRGALQATATAAAKLSATSTPTPTLLPAAILTPAEKERLDRSDQPRGGSPFKRNRRSCRNGGHILSRKISSNR